MEKNNINKAKQVLDTLSEGRLADDLKKFKEENGFGLYDDLIKNYDTFF